MNDTQQDQSEDLVVIFRAPDEVTADIVKGLLESEGIDAMVQSRRSTWSGRAALMNTIPSDSEWGDVLVLEGDAQRSLQLIHAFHTEDSEDETPTGSDWQKARWAAHYSEWSLRLPCIICGLYAIGGAYLAWAGSDTARVWFASTASATFLFYGLVLMSSQRYVPARFARAAQQVNVGLVMAGVVVGVFAIGGMGVYELSANIELFGYSLVAAASAYGALKHYPTRDQQEQEGHDE